MVIASEKQTNCNKKQVDNAPDLGDKIGEKLKKNFKLLFLCYSICKCYFDDDGSQNYLIFQMVFKSFRNLLVLLVKYLDGNRKFCPKNTLQLLLHQVMTFFKDESY